MKLPASGWKRDISSELVVVMAVMGLATLAMTVLQPVLPLYLTSIGVSPQVIGLMFSVAMVGMVIGETSWGWVADRAGLKIPLSSGTFAAALVVLFFVLTRSVASIFVIFFFWGVFRSATFGTCRGYIGANAPPLKKAAFMAIVATVLSASRSIGALPSGFIVDTWGYRWVFLFSSSVAVLGGLLVVTRLRGRKPPRIRSQTPPSSSPTGYQVSPQPLRYRPLVCQCIITTFEYLGLSVFRTYLPLLATQVVGVSATGVGVLFTVNGLISMALGIPFGILADRKGKKGFMILGLLVSAIAMVGIAFAGNFFWLVVFVIVGGLSRAIFDPAAQGLLSDSVPPQRQATAMGIYGGI